jgi:hypothetical protein
MAVRCKFRDRTDVLIKVRTNGERATAHKVEAESFFEPPQMVPGPGDLQNFRDLPQLYKQLRERVLYDSPSNTFGRLNYAKFGAADKKYLKDVRPPLPDEIP